MPLALSSRWFPTPWTAASLLEGLGRLSVRHLLLSGPPAAAATWREALRAQGVSALAVEPDPERASVLEAPRFAGALAEAARVASALKAPAVLVQAGRLPGAAGAEADVLDHALRRALARGTAATEATEHQRKDLVERRGSQRERLVEQVARSLHGPLASGLPLAVVSGDGAADLLGFAETGWLLDALPRLGLWWDAGRAERARRLGLGPPLSSWTDAHGRRMWGGLAHGLGGDLAGHAHPEDQGPDWGSLGEALPRSWPWVLDVSSSLTANAVRDALRYLEASGLFGRGGRSDVIHGS